MSLEIEKGLEIAFSLNKFYEYVEYFDIIKRESSSPYALRELQESHIKNSQYTNGITLVDDIWFITLEKLSDLLNISSTESIEKLLEGHQKIKFMDDTASFYRLTDVLSCFSKILFPFKQKSVSYISNKLSTGSNNDGQNGCRNDYV